MKQTWLFQAKPEWYDLITKVPAHIRDGEFWHPTRYYEQMNEGDHVVLWQSGKEGGVYAFGKLTAKPSRSHGRWKVHITYESLLRQPLFKRDLRKHPILNKLAVLKMPRGTDFPVTPNEWKALNAMVSKDTLNVFSHYKQQEDQFTNGLMALLEFSRHDNPSFVMSFVRELVKIKPKGSVQRIRVLKDIEGTADAEITGTDCCIRFETKIQSDSLRIKQIRDHLKWLERASETQKVLVLLTPDDHASKYIQEFLVNSWIKGFCSKPNHHVVHVEWKRVSEYFRKRINRRSKGVFAHIVAQYLRQIRDRISEQDYAGIVLKIAFGDDSEVYAETTDAHWGYLDEMKKGWWKSWSTPQPYKKLNGTGRKLLLYDKHRQEITIEVEIAKIKRTKYARNYPFKNIFAKNSLKRRSIPLDRISSLPGFENFASGRAAAWNLTREEYQLLTE